MLQANPVKFGSYKFNIFINIKNIIICIINIVIDIIIKIINITFGLDIAAKTKSSFVNRYNVLES